MGAQATETIRLDEQLCFALYNASRAFTACYRQALAPFGITYPQYLVFLALWEQSPMSVHELGDRLYLDSGTLSPLLKRLQSMGLVTRSRSEHDERVVMVGLTEQGHDLKKSGMAISAAICDVTGLSMPELKDLRERVQQLASGVRAEL